MSIEDSSSPEFRSHCGAPAAPLDACERPWPLDNGILRGGILPGGITGDGLFAQLVDPDHLARAAQRTMRGKSRRPDIAWCRFRLEFVLRDLRTRLADESWRPGPTRLLYVRDPKPRVIVKANVEDRIVHNAVALLLEPLVLRRAIFDDHACRVGHGTHRAVLRLLDFARRHRYVLHLDLRSYFPSIEPTRALSQVEACLRRARAQDPRFVQVAGRILEAGRGVYDEPRVRGLARIDADWPARGRGLPIGSSLSQLVAAHLYLQDFDHFVKRVLRVRGYVRYVDDLFVFGDRRSGVEAWRARMRVVLEEELELRLKHPRAPILDLRYGSLDGLGYRVRRAGVEPLPRAYGRLRGLLGDEVRCRRGAKVDVARSLASRMGNLFFG